MRYRRRHNHRKQADCKLGSLAFWLFQHFLRNDCFWGLGGRIVPQLKMKGIDGRDLIDSTRGNSPDPNTRRVVRLRSLF